MSRTFHARGQCFIVLSRWLAVRDVVTHFVPDQPLEAVSFCEASDEAMAMFVRSARQIAGHTNVQNAIAPVGDDVNKPAHASS